MIGSVWGLLLVGLVLASSVMALLWSAGADRRREPRRRRLPPSRAAILCRPTATPTERSPHARLDLGFRLAPVPEPIRGKEEDGCHCARANGAEREPNFCLLPVPGGLRRLLLAAVRLIAPADPA
jgi:hypothetical protein